MSYPMIALVAASMRTLGGQGVQACLLLRELRGEGYPVMFLPIDPTFPAPAGWLRRLPGVRTLLNQALYLPSLLGLRKAHVVHVFAASHWSFLIAPVPAIVAARALGKRVVLNYHSGEAGDHLARCSRATHGLMRLADEIVVPSEFLREVFERHGYRVRVIPNVVDLSRFIFRERIPLKPRLLSTRNLEPHYGVDMTIRAFAALKKHVPDATLMVAGSGSQELALRRLATSLCDGGVRFAGRVEPRDMTRLYDEHDIFVNASLVDNQPLSILEAFAAGTPVVSTAAGGIPVLVRDGENGILLPRRDPEAMAAAVESLLADPVLARRIARRALDTATEHAWPRVRDRWAAAYRGVAA
ncbi:MAG TPA: glycosyltransferase family 4 protein [Candidatus Polarisedimenticolia bacterium]|nr:glycosyltransferase family 4 protein [Candidatus Polarisedimenticolia bacterium]